MSLSSLSTKTKTYIGVAMGILGAILLFYLLIQTAEWKTDEVLQPYQNADMRLDKAVANYTPNPSFISASKFEVIKTQYDIAQSKKAHNLEIIELMNSYYFASTMLLLGLSILLGIFVLQISGSGIASKTHRFKSFFYTTLALTTFFGVLINVMNHQENIIVNKNSFLSYSATQLRIYNFLMTEGSEIDELAIYESDSTLGISNRVKVNAFITSVTKDINKTNNIFLKITHDKIKDYKEIVTYED
ncbi:MAG: hypothetical protein CL867_02190 [Cytophagaceae bacterium]|nr:hypothetical protein [Cytophagaceae bacterium]